MAKSRAAARGSWASFESYLYIVLGKQDSDLLHVHMKIVVADFTMSSCTYILQPDKHMLSSSEA